LTGENHRREGGKEAVDSLTQKGGQKPDLLSESDQSETEEGKKGGQPGGEQAVCPKGGEPYLGKSSMRGNSSPEGGKDGVVIPRLRGGSLGARGGPATSTKKKRRPSSLETQDRKNETSTKIKGLQNAESRGERSNLPWISRKPPREGQVSRIL